MLPGPHSQSVLAHPHLRTGFFQRHRGRKRGSYMAPQRGSVIRVLESPAIARRRGGESLMSRRVTAGRMKGSIC